MEVSTLRDALPDNRFLNLLDTVSPIVVWLSDQKARGSMVSRAIASHDGRITSATRLLLVALAVSALSVAAVAQSTSGRILGTLTDQTGAVVPGVTVELHRRSSSREYHFGDAGWHVEQ